jgi:hypothetical protein
MPNDVGYSMEKYSSAVLMLATSLKPLHGRLLDAYVHQAHFGTPHRNIEPGRYPVPEHLFEEIEEFDQLMSARGTYQATVEQMSDEEAVEAARIICELADKLQWASANRLAS